MAKNKKKTDRQIVVQKTQVVHRKLKTKQHEY